MSEVKVRISTSVRRYIEMEGMDTISVNASGGKVWIAQDETISVHPAAIPALIAALQAAATEAEGRDNG